jgi:peptidyl-prolyl cis-trans isomerase C
MSVSVNGVAVATAPEATPEFGAAHELLRQRAIAVGLLEEKSEDEAAIDAAIEALLAREVVTPIPTEEECRRYYDMHQREFTSGDLVNARHILFQVTPSVSVPEIRARAERTLKELLRDPTRFAAVAAEMSNCPSGQQGGNLGQLGREDTVPEFEKRSGSTSAYWPDRPTYREPTSMDRRYPSSNEGKFRKVAAIRTLRARMIVARLSPGAGTTSIARQ